MLIIYGFYAYLNEGWRYRYLSSPASVELFRSSEIPVVNITEETQATWRALRQEAIAVGRLDGEPPSVAAAYG